MLVYDKVNISLARNCCGKNYLYNYINKSHKKYIDIKLIENIALKMEQRSSHILIIKK